ncbi:hypothetical protein [Alkalihalobacterium bogoriense]|uniref:hypothetical protein n=1 Tax=Alkalihalobacterium bogoriense TaxID=246272 RepID=UPI00047BB1E1|nr:hypothetical protein [Alkalihalobacterium bogoriense]
MTKKTNEQIQNILETLQEWKGSNISIQKTERRDIDNNLMELEDVEVVKQLDDEDDYVDPYTIELKGRGTVLNAAGSKPLPLQSYELPINQLLSFEASQEFLTIKTDRATYVIKK